jgi:hypothetical protein
MYRLMVRATIAIAFIEFSITTLLAPVPDSIAQLAIFRKRITMVELEIYRTTALLTRATFLFCFQSVSPTTFTLLTTTLFFTLHVVSA